MRVVAGRLRGRRVRSTRRRGLRPTSDRVKEALFGILGDAGSDSERGIAIAPLEAVQELLGMEGRVTEVSPVILTARQESRTAEVKIQFDDRALPLKAGFSADIEIIVERASNVLRLPTHVILERERGKYVYLVTDSRAREVPIRIGASNWDFTEVAGGVREGERVAIPLDGRKLEDGRLVRVLE